MKRGYQLMKIYEIQKDYERHKQKIKSIQHLDTKKKVSHSILNQQTYSTYKKSHSIATNFIFKQTQNKVNKQNDSMYKTLIKQNQRKPTISIRNNTLTKSQSSKSIMRNTSLTIKMSRIKDQNSKIKQKIDSTRSSYEQFRKSNTANLQQKNKINPKDELKRFLENQFRIKPTVMFPPQKRNKSTVKNNSNVEEYKKGLLPKLYEKQMAKGSRKQSSHSINSVTLHA